jgi:cephalosporin-C deacetylase-like acetyl esterase
MPPRADAATLNLQPRQRRSVYEWLASAAAGRSVKHLLGEHDIAESELRETLRKLDAAGLARRVKGTWMAVPLEGANPRIPVASEVSDMPRAAS